MANVITLAVGNASEDAFTLPATITDPVNFAAHDTRRVTAEFIGKPLLENLKALLDGRVASKGLKKTFTCLSGDAVDDPVYLQAADTVNKAVATDTTKSKVIGFIRFKPTTTTCHIDHFLRKTGLSGLTFNTEVFLTDAGGFAATAGTIEKVVGIASSTTEGLLVATATDIFGSASGSSASANTVNVRNETGGTLARGVIVFLSGWNSSEDRHLITKADPNEGKWAEYYLPADLANNTNGIVKAMDTLVGTAGETVDTSSFAEGDVVYAVAAGLFSATRSVQGSVGIIRVVSATVGEIDMFLPGKRDFTTPRGYAPGTLFGLEISNATDAAHDITIVNGKARDTADQVDMILNTGITNKQIDSVWAAGSSTGGLGETALNSGINLTFNDNGGSPDDITAASGTPFSSVATGDTIIVTGSASNNGAFDVTNAVSSTVLEVATASFTQEGPVAALARAVFQDTTYHVFLISKDDQAIDFGFDRATNAATLLSDSGYDSHIRVGSILTDSSANIKGFSQHGNSFLLDNPPLDIDVNDPGSGGAMGSRNLDTVSVPSGIKVWVIYNAAAFSSGVSVITYFTSPDADDEQASFTAAPLATLNNITAHGHLGQVTTRTNGSSQIGYRCSNSDANLNVRVVTLGWIDDLKRAV